MNSRYKLTIVIGLFGKFQFLSNSFEMLTEELMVLNKREDIEIVISSSSNQWRALPLYQMISGILKNAKYVEIDDTDEIPARIFNEGIKVSSGEYINCFYLCNETILDKIDTLYNSENFRDELIDALFLPDTFSTVIGVVPSTENFYGFEQVDAFHTIFQFYIKRNIFDKVGMFNESKLLLSDFEREFLLRLSSIITVKPIGLYARKFKGLSLNRNIYPSVSMDEDLLKRYITRCVRPAFKGTTQTDIDKSFANDLKEKEKNEFYKLTGVKGEDFTEYNQKYKVLVLGGLWEYHHNQLAFLNFFENLAGKGFATFRTAFEYTIQEDELVEYDLVIFTRCRSENAIKLMDFCKRNEIKTIYMIDDNWFTVAKDMPAIGGIFVKGNPNYDNFIECIKRCDYVWAYNDILIDCIREYNKNTIKFKATVENKLFQNNKKRKRNDSKIYIGYSGSLRTDDEAFKALANVAKKHSDLVVVVFFGIMSEKQKRFFNGVKTKETGFLSYSAYAENITQISPDVLLAPLESNKTTNSKCYNKFLESAIIGAASIYSRTLPYTLVVEDEITGYYVDDETVEGWAKKLEEVISDIDKLRTVQKNAYNKVLEEYTVEKNLNEFANTLISIIGRR